MVIPNLPRELLWTDRKDFSEFLSEDLSREVVSNIFIAKSHITKKLGVATMLKLFNEAFYLSTRIVYENDDKVLPENCVNIIIDDLGNKEWAKYVILIMFMVLTLQRDKSKEVLLFVDKLQKQYLPDTPFRLLNIVINKIFKKWKEKGYRLPPCPYPADILQGINLDWGQITQGFSKHVIIGVLDLWNSDKEKGKVIRLIEQAYNTSCVPVLKDENLADRADEEFFTQQKFYYNVPNDEDMTKNAKGGRPESKSLDELFTESCSPAQREKLIDVVRSLIGKEAVYTLRVAALADVGMIKKVPSYSKAKEAFPNIGASSNYYRQKEIPMNENEIEHYKRLLIPKDSKQ